MPPPAAPLLRRIACAALVLAVAAQVGPAPARAGDDFSEVVSRYRAYRNRPSLFMRTRGRVRLAETRDPRAFRLLAADYGKAEEPPDMVRSTIVTLLTTHFVAPASLAPMYAEWRGREKDAVDAWLWFRALRLETQLAGAAEAQAAALDPTLDPFLRAAALKALVHLGRAEANALALALIEEDPKDAFARQVLCEAAVAALPTAVERPAPGVGGDARGEGDRPPRGPRASAPHEVGRRPPPRAVLRHRLPGARPRRLAHRARRRARARRLGPQAPRRALRPRPLLRAHDDGPAHGLRDRRVRLHAGAALGRRARSHPQARDARASRSRGRQRPSTSSPGRRSARASTSRARC